jgi:ribosome-associated protein
LQKNIIAFFDMITFTLESEYIPLIQLLKVVRIANSGGEAQRLVEQGIVFVNGEKESRKRAKLRIGDEIKIGNQTIIITSK